jgi:hypothetical protein
MKYEWQPIADSPTVKTYTDWRIFEKELQKGKATVEYEIPIMPCIKPSLILSLKRPIIENNEMKGNVSIDVLTKAPLYAEISSRIEEIHAANTEYSVLVEIDDKVKEPINIFVPGGNGLNVHHLVIKLE